MFQEGFEISLNYVPNFLESLELLFWIEVQSRLWQVLQIFFDVVHDASPNYPWLNSSKLDCTFPNVFTAVRTYCWTHRAVSMIWNEGKRRILLLAQHRLLHALKIIGIKMNGIAKNHSRDFYTSVLEKASRWWCCSSSPKWKLSRVELVNKQKLFPSKNTTWEFSHSLGDKSVYLGSRDHDGLFSTKTQISDLGKHYTPGHCLHRAKRPWKDRQ